MEAFLKSGKLATSKNGGGSNQKGLKEKKQRSDKPLPWVEKVLRPRLRLKKMIFS